MIDALKEINPRQIGALIAVLLIGLGGAYGAYAMITGSDKQDLEENQRLLPVTRGDLVNDVSINGSLAYPNRESLTFQTQGTVGEVLVEEGQRVVEGQPLARLDAETLASLEKAVAQAELSLPEAKASLDTAKNPYTALDVAEAEVKVANSKVALEAAQDALSRLLEPIAKDIAQAESTLANARISLEKAEADLEAFLQPSAQEIAQAESKVSNAKTALRDVQDALAGLMEPGAHDIAQAEAAVVSAKIVVENASTTLSALTTGPSDEDLSEAQSKIDSAGTTLANSQRDLDLAQIEWASRLETAGESSDSALESYQAVFSKWLGIQLADAENAMDPDSLLALWRADLASLFDAGTRVSDLRNPQGIPGDDPETRWNEASIYIWANFYPGRVSATCDNSVPFEGLCIKTEIDDAWATHRDAKDNLATIQLQGEKAVSSAEAAVIRGQDGLEDAQEGLDALREPPDALEIEAKEKQLEVALADLQGAEEKLGSLEAGPDPIDVLSRESQVSLAKANLEQAEADLAELTTSDLETNGYRALEIEGMRKQVELAQAKLDEAETERAELGNASGSLEAEASRKQLAVARATLEKQEEDLEDVLGGADPLKVALREADVAMAKVSLGAARTRLEDATIKAPWDGVISVVSMDVSDQANANNRAIEIVDPTLIEVDGVVDEIDVLFIQMGATASVTMDALPGQTLAGTVSHIASQPTTQQGVVSYPIKIKVQTQEGAELPEGLSAVASVVIREDLDVLLVPLDALYGTFEQPVVRVSTNGTVSDRDVVLGNSDGFWVVVQEGLVEAELVVMESQEASSQQGFQALRGLIGGGFGGPGGGFGRGGGGGR